MLHCEGITLRPIRAADLDAMCAAHAEVHNRRAFSYPLMRTDPRP